MRSSSLARVAVLLVAATGTALAQNTGKIAGRVTDASTGEPLVGVNILLEGTSYGSASDLEGEFVIIKIPSGTYSVAATLMGYQRTVTRNVQVLSDLTTTLNVQLAQTAIALGEEVVVVAERPMVKKDLTATEARVTAEEIQNLPLENVSQLITLQAGVSRSADGGLHIRGGRSSEISYLVNGVSMTDDYSKVQALTVETESIQELQVISGAFNAEYGNALSGVVNVITKTGGSDFQGNLEMWAGDYLSGRTDLFWGIDEVDPLATYNIQGSVSGPVLADQLTYFVTLRRSHNDGYLYGRNAYVPQGRDIPGDNSLVALSRNSRWSGQATINWQFSGDFRLKLDGFGSVETGRFYNHFYRMNPNGLRGQESRGGSGIASLTHQISPYTFQEFTFAYKYNGQVSRLYDDPYDARYVHPDSLNAPGYHFATAGTDLGRFDRNTRSLIAKYNLTSQIDKVNLAKAGIEAQFDRVFYDNITLVPARDAEGQEIIPFVPSIQDVDAPTHDRFERTPVRWAVFAQDKIELESMIINAGLRFEMFDPRGRVPSDPSDPNIYNPFKLEHVYRDANGDGAIGLDEQTTENTQTVQERESYWYTAARKKFQVSPRLGVAYPITDRGIIRFSYGLFQQIPEYSQLYVGDQYKLTSAQGLQGVPNQNIPFGNNDLEPQRTTIYELGLQQQVTDNIAVDVTAFYRDIRDWISSSPPIPTFQAGISYSQRINRDFANVRGVTLSVRRRFADNFSFSIDYTFQVADGTNSTPDAEFFSQLNGSEPTRILTPLDWDQTQTLNLNGFVGSSTWGASLIASLHTGQPYTPTRIGGAYTGRNVLTGLANNSRRKPLIGRVDVEAFKNFDVSGLTLQLFVRVHNLFDARNPVTVWGDTGEPDYTLQEQEISDYDPGWFDNPTYYSEPRALFLGTKISF